jgi:hypothetical protein
MSDDREILSVKPKRRLSKHQFRGLIAESDWVHLMDQPQFQRTLFTILDTAGMYTGNFQSDGRTHAFLEGRRSLGLDILRTAEKYLGADAHLRILSAENETQKGAPNGHGTDDRDDDDGDDGNGDTLREPGRGLVYLDYDRDDGDDKRGD